MISWMQRHRKYLVVTIWISTIAFIGAGFVGWGQYSYGDKSSAVATVGDRTVTARELQQAYGLLVNRYRKMYPETFDEEKAKQLGLQQQALRNAVNQALLLSLAESYDLQITDEEVAAIIHKDAAFHEDGRFSKELYLKVLHQNRLSASEYEGMIRDSLRIERLLGFFETPVTEREKAAYAAALGIVDKIEYKILTEAMVNVDVNESGLRAYWEFRSGDYMTDESYTVEYLTQPVAPGTYDDTVINDYYTRHRLEFTDAEGKILPVEEARPAVMAALDDKAAHKAALKQYIAYKKDKLDADVTLQKRSVSASDTPFDTGVMTEIAKLTTLNPYLKPKKTPEGYVVIKLIEKALPQPKPFEEARASLTEDYRRARQNDLMIEMAKASLEDFNGTVTADYVGRRDLFAFEALTPMEAQEFLTAVFQSHKDRGMAGLESHKMVLYHIVDQKFVPQEDPNLERIIAQMKSSLLQKNLLTNLENRFEVRSLIEGLQP